MKDAEKIANYNELMGLIGATTQQMAIDKIATFRVQLATMAAELDTANATIASLENIRHYGVRKINDQPGVEGPAYETKGLGG
jgi:hypothetical protein